MNGGQLPNYYIFVRPQLQQNQINQFNQQLLQQQAAINSAAAVRLSEPAAPGVRAAGGSDWQGQLVRSTRKPEHLSQYVAFLLAI